MGQALMNISDDRINNALRFLTKAYNLSVTQKTKFTDDINAMYRICKRKKWTIDEEKRRSEESFLYQYLSSIMTTDYNAKLSKVETKDDREFLDYEHVYIMNHK